MIRLVIGLTLLSTQVLAQEEIVEIKGQSYVYVPYEVIEEEKPTGWFQSHAESAYRDRQVILPLGVVLCDLMKQEFVVDGLRKTRVGEAYILSSEPVGSFGADTYNLFLVPETDMAQLKAASEHCATFSETSEEAGALKNPLFFFYGVWRQEPYSPGSKDLHDPDMDLHGAIFSETFGQGMFFPSYGAKPPPMKIPDGDVVR